MCIWLPWTFSIQSLNKLMECTGNTAHWGSCYSSMSLSYKFSLLQAKGSAQPIHVACLIVFCDTHKGTPRSATVACKKLTKQIDSVFLAESKVWRYWAFDKALCGASCVMISHSLCTRASCASVIIHYWSNANFWFILHIAEGNRWCLCLQVYRTAQPSLLGIIVGLRFYNF